MAEVCSWWPKHPVVDNPGKGGVPLQSRDSQTPARCSSSHCYSIPTTHLLRRMILNSGLCRLVTDTYGSSNSCSFRTTAKKWQLSSGRGQHEPTSQGTQGSLLHAHHPGQGAWGKAQGKPPTTALIRLQFALLTGESSILGLPH